MKSFLPFLIVVVIVSMGYASQSITNDEDLIVETQYGKIRGEILKASNQQEIYSFKSIPYAKPPNRFEAPVSLSVEEDGWGDETRDGTQNPPSCPQFLTGLSPISEDCLHLNVYTPVNPGTSHVKLPVMFFIHGGAFLFGDSVIYGPNRLLANSNVVLVVIHYRLGALGLLATGDSSVSGNNAFKDQREALYWVRDNIDAFGGDKNQVTIFGESAGAASVLAQLLSPSSEGLFHKVIAQSGTPLAIWARDLQPELSAKVYAESVECTTETTELMVDCLKGKTWQELAQASFVNAATGINDMRLDFGALALVVEPEGTEGAFLTREPLDILKAGDYPHIPIILGSNQHEGSMVLGAAWSLQLGQDGSLDDPNFVRFELVPKLLNFLGIDERNDGAPFSQASALYFLPEDAQRDNFTEITAGLVDMFSVYLFKAPILLTADYLSQNSDNVFLYSFEHEGFNSVWNLVFELLSAIGGVPPPPVKHGVMHADDLQYFWTLPFIITGNDRQFSDMVCKMWTDFAVTGNPTPGETWPTWSSYKTEQPHYYKLDLEPELLLDYTKNWRIGYPGKR